VDESVPRAGERLILWDGNDYAARPCPDGYFNWRVTVDEHSSSRLVRMRRSANAPEPPALGGGEVNGGDKATFRERAGQLFIPLAETITMAELEPGARVGTRKPPTRPEPKKISTARLPVTGSDLFGREEDIAFLDRAWANKDVNVVTFIWFRE
jgi:hypothetical protein